MKLSVIIPVYNESATLQTIIEKVRNVSLEKEIVIVNDASTDATPQLLSRLSTTYPDLRIVHHQVNRGKGAAIRTGIEHASGNIIIVQDADLEYDPEDYYVCVEPIVRGECKVVYGSRNLNKKNRHEYLSFYLGGYLVTIVTNLLFGSSLTDEPTCYKTFEAALIKSIPIVGERFEWEPEVTAKILKMGIEIKEVPIRYYPRSIKEGKHIRWRDGVLALWTLLKYRFIK